MNFFVHAGEEFCVLKTYAKSLVYKCMYICILKIRKYFNMFQVQYNVFDVRDDGTKEYLYGMMDSVCTQLDEPESLWGILAKGMGITSCPIKKVIVHNINYQIIEQQLNISIYVYVSECLCIYDAVSERLRPNQQMITVYSVAINSNRILSHLTRTGGRSRVTCYI